MRNRRDVLDRLDLQPAVASAWIADSRPVPGPCTRTCTRFTPSPSASRAHCSAATVAANGVDFLDPLKPALPDEPQATVLPCMSVIVMVVLLNVAVMCAMPSASTTRFASCLWPVSVGMARMTGMLHPSDRAYLTWSPSSCRRSRDADPSWCARWCACAGRAPAARGDGGCRGTSRCPSVA